MPIHERRYNITLLVNENNKKKEQIEENTSNNSKGSRTTKISGDQLKMKMKSGEIPS